MLDTRPEARSATQALAQALANDPLGYFDASAARMHAIPRVDLEAAQFAALKTRFADLRDRLPMLQKLADEQGVRELETLEDVVPLLFPHTVYKSYPPSLLEKSRFPLLTKWLTKLTTVDLSGVDTSACRGIDEWVELLETEAGLEIRHSSGTSGTMSFVPRSQAEAERGMYLGMVNSFEASGLEPPRPGKPQDMHVVHPNYRSGSSAILRSSPYTLRLIAGGDETKFHALYPDRQSADVMFLAGRINAAAARGELDRLELSPEMRARKADFDALQKSMPAKQEAFLTEMAETLKGEKVYMQGTWNVLYKIAKAALDKGVEGVFSSQSVVRTGGGAKGMVVPDDWEQVIQRYVGVDMLHHAYSMTELSCGNSMCSHERFHIQPWFILYVLDPDTGAPHPRQGVQTGRAAFFDLLAETYWGGFVTGDEVSVDWNPCACGRTTPHLARTIERYSAMRGGDDKISCAAAADAHENAIQFLSDTAD